MNTDSLRTNIWADIIAHVPPDQRSMSTWKWLLQATKIILLSSGFHVTFLYRIGNFLRQRSGLLGLSLSKILFWVSRHFYVCAIASTASIGGGIILPHPQGIVIGSDVKIGSRTWIFQNVTIGGSPGKEGHPTIGNDCRIYTGAVIVGPIEIADNCLIGANTVTSSSIAPNTLVKCASTILVALASD
jgi:serine O-acetyltransferase